MLHLTSFLKSGVRGSFVRELFLNRIGVKVARTLLANASEEKATPFEAGVP